MGRQQTDRQRRIDEVLYRIEDRPAANVLYVGLTDSFLASKADPVWQIKRVSKTGNETTTMYADHGKYSQIWNDRVSLFPAVALVDEAQHPQNVAIFDENGNAFTPGNPLPVTGSLSLGIVTQGLVTVVSINDTGWTALPAVSVADRKALCVYNTSGVEIKLNYATPGGYVGVPLVSGNQRFYSDTNIIVYARSSSGSVNVTVEEMS